MTDFLFALPWWVPTGLIVMGSVLFITGNSRLERRVRAVGLGLIILAIVASIVSYLIDTPTEKAEKQTRQLVQAVNGRNWKQLETLLDPETTLAIYSNRDMILHGAKLAAEQFGFKSARILSLESTRTDTLISVTFTALSEQDFTAGYPLTSTWRLDYQQTANGWFLASINIVAVGNESPQQAIAHLPR